jgi:hypothetical protein
MHYVIDGNFMLEDIAIRYVSLPEGDLRAIALGLVILGAIFAGLLTRSKSELARAPYFAFTALAVLVASVGQFMSLNSLSAMAGGYLWGLMAAQLSLTFMIGFFFGTIAMARSRDAYGHGGYAALAFIPLANLVLLSKPGKVLHSTNRIPTAPVFSDGMGVLSGFVILFVVAALNVYFEQETNAQLARINTEPVSQQASVNFLIRSKGLEAALREIASGTQTPILIDNVTTLARIEADTTQLRRIYVINREGFAMTNKFRDMIQNGICAYAGFIPLLRAGVSMREVYVKPDGTQIGAHIVTREVCGL